MTPLLTTDFPNLKLFRRGKVRDVYDLGEYLLFVATDRLSAFDVVLPDPIPMKGAVLTAMSEYWFETLGHMVRHHFVTSDAGAFPAECAPYIDQLRGRSMLVRKTRPIQIEAIVRGYLTGSGLKEYQKSGTVCGIALPGGLVDGSLLPEPIFTPSTKAEEGHDENISFDKAAEIAGADIASAVRDRSIEVYSHARNLARERGIIIADTKFEFGIDSGGIVLIDEVLTPDSSRFWPMKGYAPGSAQPSFDKQYVRDHLIASGWDRNPPAPHLPPEVIARTTEKYLEAYSLLTGRTLDQR
jgi:phosphoribosylaminoimidazole-succinocarboxamide synthase